jgi:hypothetical protein
MHQDDVVATHRKVGRDAAGGGEIERLPLGQIHAETAVAQQRDRIHHIARLIAGQRHRLSGQEDGRYRDRDRQKPQNVEAA